MKNTKNAAGNSAQKTIRPIEASSVCEAEFVNSPGLESGFGIKRSLAYALEAEGLIKGVSLRRRGSLKGKKLWCVASVRAYLNSQMAGAK